MYCTAIHISSTCISKIEKYFALFLLPKGKLSNSELNKWWTGLINHSNFQYVNVLYLLNMFERKTFKMFLHVEKLSDKTAGPTE